MVQLSNSTAESCQWLGRNVNTKDSRALELLEAIAERPDVRQVDLAGRIGVAVGTVNWLLKRLSAKGYVKVQRIGQWQWRYLLTSSGVREKARLTRQYLQASLRVYRKTREEAQALLGELKRAGQDTVRIDSGGWSDLLDIYRLTCSELGITAVEGENSQLPTLRMRGTKVVLETPESGVAQQGGTR
jgi:DNA-binding MarR family transcriptional regulator